MAGVQDQHAPSGPGTDNVPRSGVCTRQPPGRCAAQCRPPRVPRSSTPTTFRIVLQLGPPACNQFLGRGAHGVERGLHRGWVDPGSQRLRGLEDQLAATVQLPESRARQRAVGVEQTGIDQPSACRDNCLARLLDGIGYQFLDPREMRGGATTIPARRGLCPMHSGPAAGFSFRSPTPAATAQGIAEPLRQFETIMEKLGRAGIWAHPSKVSPEVAGELERLGYSTLWLGASPAAELDVVDPLLEATETLVVGTSIVNIWTAPATSVGESFHRLEAKYPGRFVLGIGAGHRENEADYRKPYEALVDYLDELDRAGVPVQQRALAALGPRVLELARTRSAGALPYLVTPEHTRSARAQLGPDALLVVEQKVVVDTDPRRGRSIGRDRVGPYLRLSNYVANLRRIGFDADDVAFPGSDRLVDALAIHGGPETVGDGLRAHLAAGANQVAIQVLSADDDILPGARVLAQLL